MTAIGLIDRDYWPDLFLNSLPNGVTALPAHEIESLFCIKEMFIAVAKHLGRTDSHANTLYLEFCSEAASRFREGLLLKQISERFKTRCMEQVNRSLNSLHIEGSEADVRGNHCSALSPEKWSIAPDSIFDEEKATIEIAIQTPYESLIKLLPGKVYLGILANKLGLEKAAYVDLVVDALSAADKEPLHTLGVELRNALVGVLPDS